MFIKETTFKRKSGRKVTYLQLVTSIWDKEKKTPRHKVLCSLGRADQIDQNQLKSLIDKLATYVDEPDIDENGKIQVGQTYEFGIPYLVQQVFKSLSLDRFFTAQLTTRQYEKPLHQAILGMVINRCFCPLSKRSTHQWLKEEVYFPIASRLELHHYYRAMDFLLDCDQELELALYDHYTKRRNLAPEIVFYDTTSSYFETETEADDQLRQYGYSRDHRPDRRQIVLGVAVDKQGLPLASDIFAGNTTDVTTVKRLVKRLSGLGISRCIFVSDSAMLSRDNLDALEDAEFEVLMGTKMRQVTQVRKQALSKRGRFIELGDGLGAKEVVLEKVRYIVVGNEKQARKDALIRGEIVERLQVLLEQIEQGKASVCDIQHPLMKRFIRTLKDGRVKLNATKVASDAIYDGKYVLHTTSALSLEEAIAGYKTLNRIEQGFRTIKSVLEIRPMFHHADQRIKSHVKLCTLAYFIVRHIEIQTGQSWSQILRQFRPLRVVELKTPAGTVWRCSQLSTDQKAILKKLSLPRPKEIQKISLNS